MLLDLLALFLKKRSGLRQQAIFIVELTAKLCPCCNTLLLVAFPDFLKPSNLGQVV